MLQISVIYPYGEKEKRFKNDKINFDPIAPG